MKDLFKKQGATPPERVRGGRNPPQVIYHTKTVNLEKRNKDEWTLTVDWHGPMRKFWTNFPFPLLRIISQDKVSDVRKRFVLKAESVKTLATFLKERKNRINYDDALAFLYDVGNQLKSLERFYLAVPFIDVNDIIVVDDKHYFYLNDQKVFGFGGSSGLVEIDRPYKKSPFFSPEFKNISSLPASISYKSGFYSLAVLISYCMLNEYIKNDDKQEILAPIYTTELYWALMRMLQKDPQDRFYLII